MEIMIGITGILTLLMIAVLFSQNRRAINLRTVGLALILQLSMGAITLYIPQGRRAIEWFSNIVGNVLGYGAKGAEFLFGALISDKMFEVFGGAGFVFALRVLPTIVFFSALISVLYYLGIMQLVIKIIGGLLRRLLGTSHTESMSAAANIFVGQTEAPLLVKPYIGRMTKSELFAVMCGGLASIAGSVLAGLASFGVDMKYLITASFMAAPGGLLFAKLLIPETSQPVNFDEATRLLQNDQQADKPSNVIDAAAIGTITGTKLAINVGAMLLTFTGLLLLINGMLGGIGNWFGQVWTLELILGTIFKPLAFLIGIPWSDAQHAGALLGQKIIVNEFFAYSQFAPILNGTSDIVMSEKTKVIISFALCGFANLSSIGILVGGLGAMAPERRQDIAKMGLLAVLAGTLSNLMSATLAGIFFSIL